MLIFAGLLSIAGCKCTKKDTATEEKQQEQKGQYGWQKLFHLLKIEGIIRYGFYYGL